MFNWFKNKQKHLLPKDISEGMMSSLFTTIHLGEKITIPDNCIGYVSYKDKIYNTLESGTHTLSKELLIDLYEKQSKNENKLKKLKIDLFFVNLSNFSYSFDYIDKIPIDNTMTKLIFSISVNMAVNNPEEFRDCLLAEFAGISSKDCENLILSYIEEIIRSHFLRVKLDDFSIPFEEQQKVKYKLENKLNKIGVSLNLIKLTVSSKATNNELKTFNFDDEFENDISTQETKDEEESENTIDQTSNLYYNNESCVNTIDSPNLCSNCKCKIIKGSIYCHRCGKSFK